jgi:hypothetical protein
MWKKQLLKSQYIQILAYFARLIIQSSVKLMKLMPSLFNLFYIDSGPDAGIKNAGYLIADTKNNYD